MSDLSNRVDEIHARAAEFQKAYTVLAIKYPDRFPMKEVTQTAINLLFARYLQTGKIVNSPNDLIP